MNVRELRKGMLVIENSITKLQSMTNHNEGRNSRELSLAFTTTQLTRMWLGELLKVAKLAENPYKEFDGKREVVNDIKPLFDATDETLSKDIFDKGIIYTIDQVREYISSVKLSVITFMEAGENFVENIDYDEIEESLIATALFNIYSKLTEIRMWLGMELGRIRDNQQ